MTSSRAAQSAKLAKQHQRRQSSATAKSFGSKFAEKQSHYERRQEEEQIKSTSQFSGGMAGSIQTGDRLLSNKWGRDEQGSAPVSGSMETPSPFAVASEAKRGSRAASASTQGLSTFGLSKKVLAATTASTRSTRRAALFNLNENNNNGGNNNFAAMREGESLLGRAARSPLDEIANRDADGEDEPPRKMTREEKFREVLSKSKSNRAQLQRERAEREEETKALDAEINALLHLLPKRNKDDEEREAFLNSGTPEMRALLAKYKEGHTAKHVVVKSSGEYSMVSLGQDKAEAAEDKVTAAAPILDDKDKQLLSKLRLGAVCSAEEADINALKSASEDKLPRKQQADKAATHYAEDDFDRLLNTMRIDTRRAHATDRTLDDEELAELEAQQLMLEEDRRAVPSLGLQERDMKQLTRGEWLEQGGERAFMMNEEGLGDNNNKDRVYDDDNVDIPSSYEGDSDVEDVEVGKGRNLGDEGEDDEEHEGEDLADPTAVGESAGEASSSAPVLGSAVLDKLLSEIEAIAKNAEDASKDSSYSAAEMEKSRQQRASHFEKVLRQLYRYAKTHLLEVSNAFRLILMEAERSFLRGQRRTLGRPMMLYLFTISKLFPMTDYRHEVTTPFIIFICSTLMQTRLETLEGVHEYLGLTAMLVSALTDGNKFSAEAVVACFNVISLQVGRSVLEPVRYQGLGVPFPLVDRSEGAVLTADGLDKEERAASAPHQLLGAHGDAASLVLFAYTLLGTLVEQFRTMPAFPVVFLAPLRALDAVLAKSALHQASSAVREAHAALMKNVVSYSAAVEDHRTPLAMRTFRPRPIRLFEPLLAELEETAVKTELRAVKKEIREDKKRVMRHLTAEATVTRRAREKEQSATDAQREKKLHQVMGQLQAQQHTMNTVDAFMEKARSKRKKGISGAPKESDSGDNVPEY